MLTACQYAIRESIRNNKSLKRDAIIQLIASLIGERHKVNLGSPDKVILVDIYQVRKPGLRWGMRC